MFRRSSMVLVFGAVALSVACGDAETPDEPEAIPATFENVAPLIAEKCGACHDGTSGLGENFQMDGGVNATPAQVRASLESGVSTEGEPFLTPSDKDNSQVYVRLFPGVQSQMPLGTPLRSSETKLIGDWIEAGASFE